MEFQPFPSLRLLTFTASATIQKPWIDFSSNGIDEELIEFKTFEWSLLLSSPLLGYRSIIWGGVWRTPHVCWVIWLIDVKLYQRQDRMVELSCWSIRKLYWHTITIRNCEQWTQISTFYLLYLINHESSFQPTGLRGFKNHNLRLLYNIVFPLCLSFLFTVKLKVSVSPSNNTLQILGEFLARIVNKK